MKWGLGEVCGGRSSRFPPRDTEKHRIYIIYLDSKLIVLVVCFAELAIWALQHAAYS